MRIRAAVARALHLVRWYVGELTGDAEFARHCARLRQLHPDQPVPTRRAYELARSRRRDHRPIDRCC
ncbi:YbdD/YjiX family protein [Amycolatopsis sp. NPDC051128]|uniref:YbdD/YjiX family protein n=1 Tax=Amycolatopsis sp. NPDC051128 TaxID=3155412 RepID=UPI003446A360